MFYWNLRKTVWRADKGRGRCPCQNPSDSGRAGETMCEAALHYHNPRRFRVVCPLLKENEEGQIRCSVDTPDVRSFWFRALFIYSTGIFSVYAAAVLAVFGFMRQVGYPVSLMQIANPAAWSQINDARSEYFLTKAQTAYAAGDVNEAVLSLSLAYDFNPRNYDAGLLLANLWQAGRPDASNALYQRLLREHPEQRPQTAQSWLRALLPRGDFASIESLALQALRFDRDFAAAWIHAFLYANERTRNSEMLTRALQQSEDFPPGVSQILRLEAEVRSRRPEVAAARLATLPEDGTPTFVAYYQIRRLIDLNAIGPALEMLNIIGPQLSDRDRITLQLRAYAQSGYRRLHVNLFERVLELSLSPVQVELLSQHLITHPDQELYERFVTSIDPMRLADPAQQHAALIAMFCVAGSQRDRARLEHYAEVLRQITGTPYTALNVAAQMFLNPRSMRFGTLAAAVQPMSLDLTYAMLDRFLPRSSP